MDVNVRQTKGVQLLDGKRKVTARIDPLVSLEKGLVLTQPNFSL